MQGPEDYMNYGTSEVFVMAENKDVEGLIGVLIHNKKKHVVKRAIFALGEIKDKKAVEPLIEVWLKSGLITIRLTLYLKQCVKVSFEGWVWQVIRCS